MKDVKVLGPGCKRCDAAVQMVKDAAAAAHIEVAVKVTDYAEIAQATASPRRRGSWWTARWCMRAGLPKAEDLARWIAA